jgi:molybdopterin adenylyltransferase
MSSKPQAQFIQLNIAVVTVSDTRTEDNDDSGRYLSESLLSAGHELYQKHIVKDDLHKLRALVATLIADDFVHAVPDYRRHWLHPARQHRGCY